MHLISLKQNQPSVHFSQLKAKEHTFFMEREKLQLCFQLAVIWSGLRCCPSEEWRLQWRWPQDKAALLQCGQVGAVQPKELWPIYCGVITRSAHKSKLA